MMHETDKLDNLFSKIQASPYTVALTGAGVSTLSGLPDFRGPQGLYRSMQSRTMFDLDAFYQNPAFFYEQAVDFIYSIDKIKPSIVHRTLGNMENRGLLKAVITQNIDMLHQKGGSRNVIEVHGSPMVHRCMECAQQFPYDKVAAVVREGQVPLCNGCGGLLKPNITFFGEALPMQAFERATLEAAKASLLLILGTSLSVFPAAALPQRTIENNGEIVIVNASATDLDHQAVLVFSDLQTVFEYMNDRLVSYGDGAFNHL